MSLIGLIAVLVFVTRSSERDAFVVEILGGAVIAAAIVAIDARQRRETQARQLVFRGTAGQLAARTLTGPIGPLDKVLSATTSMQSSSAKWGSDVSIADLGGVAGMVQLLVSRDLPITASLVDAARETATAVMGQLDRVETRLLDLALLADDAELVNSVYQLRLALEECVEKRSAREMLESTVQWITSLKESLAVYERRGKEKGIES